MTIDSAVRKTVISQWLSGSSRDRIAADNNIGAGTASNFIAEFKKGVQNSDYDSVRELAIHCKKEGFGSIANFTQALRIKKFLEGLGFDLRDKEESVENLMSTLAMQSEPTKLIEVAGQITQILDVPLSELKEHIKTKQAELSQLEEKIQAQQIEMDALGVKKEALEKEIEVINIDRKAAEEVKAEIKKYGLDPDLDPKRLIHTLEVFRRFNFDCNMMVNSFLEVQDIVAETGGSQYQEYGYNYY